MKIHIDTKRKKDGKERKTGGTDVRYIIDLKIDQRD